MEGMHMKQPRSPCCPILQRQRAPCLARSLLALPTGTVSRPRQPGRCLDERTAVSCLHLEPTSWGADAVLLRFEGTNARHPPALPGNLHFSSALLAGNCDIKNLTRGCKVYFPVFVEGANLSMGDMHFSQGDGEVSFCGES